MDDKVRIGILGCANIAQRYAIKAFQSIENSEVVSIASRNREKAKNWASLFGLKAEESYESLVVNPEIDAVYIPLPIGLHKEWIFKAVAAGKHIICEKSLAESFSSVKEIVSACRSKKIVLYENFMCDFHPQHEKVLSLIKNGDIGRPFVFRGYFGFPMMDKDDFRYNKELGGGSLNDAGAYTVFMARKIFQNEPISVVCNLFYDKSLGVDLKGTAHLEFPEEKVAFLAFNFNAVYQNNYSVWGEKGLINVGRAYSIPPDTKPTVELTANINLKDIKTDIDITATNHFKLIFRDFCDTVLNKDDRKGKINDTYLKIINQAKVLEAMRLSSKENRKIKIAEIK